MRRNLAVLVLVAVALAGCGGSADRPLPSRITELEPGDCFDGTGVGSPFWNTQPEVPFALVDCAQPHDNEVFVVFDHPDPPEGHPGTLEGGVWQDPSIQGVSPTEKAAFNAVIQAECEPALAVYVSEPDRYRFDWLYPDGLAWAGGDRTVVCYLFDRTRAKLTAPVG